ncbi:YkgJ family cysteine cluster protein [Deinococcus sp. Marseille-Q6407]|uniref:YkgJ family cysteine cluster protein n=1 Tax=Deinococcus sp. Marseille-Q6407 TaxID=2969223 RepID=UPI0021BE3218|nr:YkgJ family cysteine cluster protein [Deinococcus sp. Marseille-Q6407]
MTLPFLATPADLDPGEAVPPGYPPRSAWPRAGRECTACGACCSAPDIAALHKPLGVPCQHLGAGCLCAVYPARPAICRSYQPDWVCGEVASLPTLEARTRRFLEIYGLLEEAGVQPGTRTPERP